MFGNYAANDDNYKRLEVHPSEKMVRARDSRARVVCNACGVQQATCGDRGDGIRLVCAECAPPANGRIHGGCSNVSSCKNKTAVGAFTTVRRAAPSALQGNGGSPGGSSGESKGENEGNSAQGEGGGQGTEEGGAGMGVGGSGGGSMGEGGSEVDEIRSLENDVSVCSAELKELMLDVEFLDLLSL